MPQDQRGCDPRTFAAGMEFMLMVLERRLDGSEGLSRDDALKLVHEYRDRARRLKQGTPVTASAPDIVER